MSHLIGGTTALLRRAPIAKNGTALARTSTSSVRPFSHLPNLRPSVLLHYDPSITAGSGTTIFRRPDLCMAVSRPIGPLLPCLSSAAADVVPASAVRGTHPCLTSMRFGPRPTMSGATRLVQKRRHGFLCRIRTARGKKTLKRRKAKGRLRLSA